MTITMTVPTPDRVQRAYRVIEKNRDFALFEYRQSGKTDHCAAAEAAGLELALRCLEAEYPLLKENGL